MTKRIERLFKTEVKDESKGVYYIYVNGKKVDLYKMFSLTDIAPEGYDGNNLDDVFALQRALKKAAIEKNLRLFHGNTIDKWCVYPTSVFSKKHIYVVADKKDLRFLIGPKGSNITEIIEKHDMPAGMRISFVEKKKRS